MRRAQQGFNPRNTDRFRGPGSLSSKRQEGMASVYVEGIDRGMEEFFARRGFGQRVGWGERPALLVIDYMVGFTDPALPLGSDLTSEIEATVRLLEAARAAGIPRFFSAARYDEPDLADAGVWGLKQGGIKSLPAGSPNVELDPRLSRRSDEAIIWKKYASCFFGTDLVARLNARRVDTLVLAGCTTSGCVRATAVDGVQNGFRVQVVAEAVGDRHPAAHRQSLFDLDAKYADVCRLDEALSRLAP